MTLVQLDLVHLLDIARSVTGDAERLFHNGPGEVRFKGDRDMVSETDVAIERMIRSALRTHTPGFGFEGEETGVECAGAATRWILDPLDGTANYIRDLPLCGISLALVHEQTPVLGVITPPYLRRRYWAAAGRGAGATGNPSRHPRRRRSRRRWWRSGTTPRAGDEERDLMLRALVPQLAERAQRTRMFGTSAMDLVTAADEGVDASVTLANRDWDMAAGVVIAREAGAKVSDADGHEHTTASLATIVAAPGVYEELLTVVRDAARGSRYAPAPGSSYATESR